jgi:hypothetical protein
MIARYQSAGLRGSKRVAKLTVGVASQAWRCPKTEAVCLLSGSGLVKLMIH